MINLTYFLDRSKDVAVVIDLWRQSAKIGTPHPHLYSVHWHSTTDGRIATWMRALTLSSTSDKNSVNFGPITPECVCAGHATRWALLRIFSSLY